MSDLSFEFTDIFPYLLVLARIMGALFTLPGLSSPFINSQVRLLLGVSMTFVLTPILAKSFPSAPEEPFLFFAYIAFESFIGIFIGTMGKMLLASLDLAGTVFGLQSGLMNAFVSDPVDGRQSSLPAVYLTSLVMVLIFVGDIHHIILQSLYDSYQVFHPALITEYPHLQEDFMFAVLRMLEEGFILGTQIAAPIIILAILFFMSLGLLNRLMPQLHVFFIFQSFQIYISFLILALIITSACSSVLERLAQMYASIWIS